MRCISPTRLSTPTRYAMRTPQSGMQQPASLSLVAKTTKQHSTRTLCGLRESNHGPSPPASRAARMSATMTHQHKMSNATASSDHRWDGIVAQDHARLHNGHVYNQVNSVYHPRYHIKYRSSSSTNHADLNDQIYTIMPQTRRTHQRRQTRQKENGEPHCWVG